MSALGRTLCYTNCSCIVFAARARVCDILKVVIVDGSQQSVRPPSPLSLAVSARKALHSWPQRAGEVRGEAGGCAAGCVAPLCLF